MQTSSGAVRSSGKAKPDPAAAKEVLQRAKTILMATQGMDEPQAHRFLQQLSMKRRKSIAEIAEAVVLADELMGTGR